MCLTSAITWLIVRTQDLGRWTCLAKERIRAFAFGCREVARALRGCTQSVGFKGPLPACQKVSIFLRWGVVNILHCFCAMTVHFCALSVHDFFKKWFWMHVFNDHRQKNGRYQHLSVKTVFVYPDYINSLVNVWINTVSYLLRWIKNYCFCSFPLVTNMPYPSILVTHWQVFWTDLCQQLIWVRCSHPVIDAGTILSFKLSYFRRYIIVFTMLYKNLTPLPGRTMVGDIFNFMYFSLLQL